MAKSFIILCTVLLISAAFADDAAKELAAAKTDCMKSINEAQNDGRDVYQELPTSPDEFADAIWKVYQKGILDLNVLREEVQSATTMEVTTEVESAFKKRILCSDDIAQRARDITVAMRDGLVNDVNPAD